MHNLPPISINYIVLIPHLSLSNSNLLQIVKYVDWTISGIEINSFQINFASLMLLSIMICMCSRCRQLFMANEDKYRLWSHTQSSWGPSRYVNGNEVIRKNWLLPLLYMLPIIHLWTDYFPCNICFQLCIFSRLGFRFDSYGHHDAGQWTLDSAKHGATQLYERTWKSKTCTPSHAVLISVYNLNEILYVIFIPL